MRAIDKLIAKYPPPPEVVDRGIEDDWAAVHQRIGSVLPRDYKDFINAYGSVYIDKFWSPFNPFSANVYMNLVDQMAMRLSALRVLKEQFGESACPYPLWFEPQISGRLLSKAVAHTGTKCSTVRWSSSSMRSCHVRSRQPSSQPTSVRRRSRRRAIT
jgi:hypothetical protein